MSTLRKRLCVALCVIACACMAVVGVTFANSQKASAEAYSTSPVMVDGASIRLDAQKNGIRFATYLPTSFLESIDWEITEMGTLFIPKAVLDANDKAATDLKLDATFGGISPAVAEFDGNTDNLVADPAFEGGYLVNAVLELTSFTNVEQALNGEIVARSYVIIGGGDPIYLDPVTRAPAFVAAEEILETEEGVEYDATLNTYVQHVEIVTPANVNVSAWEDGIDSPFVTNVAGITVDVNIRDSYACTPQVHPGGATVSTLAKLEGGKLIGLNEGCAPAELSAIGGKLTKTVNVNVTMPQVAFYSSAYVPTRNFTIFAKDVASVSFDGGEPLTLDTDYTLETYEVWNYGRNVETPYAVHEDSVIVIDMNTLLGEANTFVKEESKKYLTITTTEGFVSQVPVYSADAEQSVAATTTNIRCKLILLEANLSGWDIGTLEIGTDSQNYKILKMARIFNYTGATTSRFNINADYVAALAAATGKTTIGARWNFITNTGAAISCGYSTGATSNGSTTAGSGIKSAGFPVAGNAFGDGLTSSDSNCRYTINVGSSAAYATHTAMRNFGNF